MDYLQLTAPGALNPLSLMAAPLKNVSMAPAIHAGNASFDFLYQVGDAVFTHAEAYSKIPNRAVSGPVLQWLMSLPAHRELSGHSPPLCRRTHTKAERRSATSVSFASKAVACAQSYQSDAKIRSTRPPVMGWSVIFQEGGVTDHSESRFICAYRKYRTE
jgi:hypothetical protein